MTTIFIKKNYPLNAYENKKKQKNYTYLIKNVKNAKNKIEIVYI